MDSSPSRYPFGKKSEPKCKLEEATENKENDRQVDIFKLLKPDSSTKRNRHERKKEVAEFLLKYADKAKSLKNSKSHNDSILHTAVRNRHEDLVYWMIAHFPELSSELLQTRNESVAGETPIDIARATKQDCVLQFFQTPDDERVTKLVLGRARNFVFYFFNCYRAELERFSNLAKQETQHQSSVAKKIKSAANGASKITFGILKVAIPIVDKIDSMFYGERPEKIFQAHDVFGLEPLQSARLKAVLLKTGILVFSRFEQYFVEGATWSNWTVKQKNLVPACVERIMNFHDTNSSWLSLEREEMCESFLKGKEKDWLRKTGKNKKWSALDKSGIVQSSENETKQYKRKVDSDTCKYGYRKLFPSELQNSSEECLEILEEGEPWNKYHFHFCDEEIGKWLRQVDEEGDKQNRPAEDRNCAMGGGSDATNSSSNPGAASINVDGLFFKVPSSSGKLTAANKEEIGKHLWWEGGTKHPLYIIYGAPGVGKQHLASEYANFVYHDQHKKQANVVWIEGNCAEQDFEELYRELDGENCPKFSTMPEDCLEWFVKRIYARLKSLPTLIVFHKVDTLESIERFLPLGIESEYGFQILVTTEFDWTLDVDKLKRRFIFNENDNKGGSNVPGQNYNFWTKRTNLNSAAENQPGTSSRSNPSGRKHKGVEETKHLHNLDITTYVLLRYRENFNISFKKLQGFTQTEAVEYLKKALKLPIQTDDDVSDLAKLLNVSPMALVQVCDFINQKPKYQSRTPSIQDVTQIFANGDWKNVHQILSLELSPAVGSVISKWNRQFTALQDEEPYGELMIPILRKLVYLNQDDIKLKNKILTVLAKENEVLAECFSLLAYYNILSQDEKNPSIWHLNKMAKLVIQSELFMDCSEEVYSEMYEFLRDLKTAAETMEGEEFSRHESIIVGAHANFETLMRKLLLHSEYDDAVLSLMEEICGGVSRSNTTQPNETVKSDGAIGEGQKSPEEPMASAVERPTLSSGISGVTPKVVWFPENKVERTFGYSATANRIMDWVDKPLLGEDKCVLLVRSPLSFKTGDIMGEINTLEEINKIKMGIRLPREALETPTFRSTTSEEKHWLLKILSRSLFGCHLPNFINLLENWTPAFTKLFLNLLHGLKKSDCATVKSIILHINQANISKMKTGEIPLLIIMVQKEVSEWPREICINVITMQSEPKLLMETASILKDELIPALTKMAVG